VETIEDEVRELVRRRGLDPVGAPDEARALVDEVIADYSERVLSSALPPVADPGRVRRTVLDSVAGFGPLQRWLDDPEVEEVWINEPGRVFVARRGRSELTTTVLAAADVRDLVERMLRSSGRRLDVSAPFVDATLPDGSRLHAVIPDVTRRHVAVNIRKFVVRAGSVDDLVRLGTLTARAARFLEAAVVAGLSILVSGGTQAGKTTTLNALLAAIPARERLITVEEVFELRPPAPDWVAMQTRQPSLEGTGEITLRRLVKEALRMRPDRLVVGEVRQAECLDLLLALNSGVPGMCSVHANSAREALLKMCTLPLSPAAPSRRRSSRRRSPGASTSSCTWRRTRTGGGASGRSWVCPGRVEGAVIETADLFVARDGRLVRAAGFPPRAERFARLGLDLPSLLAA